MITFTTTKTKEDIKEIIALQQTNLFTNLSEEEKQSQGFVTIEHPFDLLFEMHEKHPHIVAKSAGKIVGYALVELQEFQYRIPALIPMTEQINKLDYKGIPLKGTNYCIMGQVCIAKDFRGQGVFYSLYDKFKKETCANFDFVITEIDSKNIRSMKAHKKAGWKSILTYTADNGKEWNMVILELKKQEKL